MKDSRRHTEFPTGSPSDLFLRRFNNGQRRSQLLVREHALILQDDQYRQGVWYMLPRFITRTSALLRAVFRPEIRLLIASA